MNTRFRVGKDSDGTYVWDRQIQPESKDLCLLWCHDNKALEIYETKLVTSYVKPVTESELVTLAIESYIKWYSENGTSFIDNRRNELIKSIKESFENKLKEREEKHKMFLREKGIPYNGVRPETKNRPHRSTHCWACKEHLDNTMQVECATCGWIICKCGACGCGY